MHTLWTTKIKPLFSAILWVLIAIVLPDAAAAEMGKRIVADPNDAEISTSDVLLYFGMEMADVAAEVGLGDEFAIIARAAIRNNCFADNFYILLAIRKAENGRAGREFGILHWRCDREMAKRPKETLDIQAGWAAATVAKNRARWQKEGNQDGFIWYLAHKYCPKETDPKGNKNWRINVTYWTAKIRGIANSKLQ